MVMTGFVSFDGNHTCKKKTVCEIIRILKKIVTGATAKARN